MGEFRKFACPRCLGAGKVFQCDRWVASDGKCCPPGERRESCSGHKATCGGCGGTGLRGYSTPSGEE